MPTNNFLLGEVSSKFFGRYDIREISQACRSLVNSIVRPQGGAFRRPGTRFITSTALGAVSIGAEVRLIPWVISKTEAYVVMIGTGDDSTSNWPETPINIYRVSTDTWYTGGHVSRLGYSDTWVALTTTQLEELKYAQFADRMVITHPDHQPFIISRLAATKFYWWQLGQLFENYDMGTATPTVAPSNIAAGGGLPGVIVDMASFPFHDNPDSGHTLKVSATSGAGVTLTSNNGLFSSSHVGSRFKLLDTGSGVEGICLVTAVTSSLLATVTIVAGATMGSTATTTFWKESSWSLARGWPRDVVFHQSRLVFAGNTTFPNRIWFSQLDDIFEMRRPSTGANDTDAFSADLATGELNAIQWINSDKTLIVGTAGQEIIVEGTDPNEAISNSNFAAHPETGYGSEYVKPVRIDNALLFVQRTGQKVREFQFNFDENAYKSRDLNRYGDHIGLKAYDYYASVTVPKFIQLAYLSGDNPAICALDNNGVLNFLIRDQESTAIAWCPVKLGGNLGGTEPPKVLSMCVVPSYSSLDDELWLLVKRTVNSSTVYYIERITREFFGTGLAQSSAPNSHFYPYYVDCAINQTLGAPGTVFNGFTRLNGETVHVLADGNYIGTKVVSGNTITLASNATTITAGYTYRSIVSPILPDMGSQIGNSIGAVKRINEVAIRFRRTVAAWFGRTSDAADIEEITFRPASVSLSLPIPLFDGIKRRHFNGEYDRDPQVYILQDSPLPMEVCSFSADGTTYD